LTQKDPKRAMAGQVLDAARRTEAIHLGIPAYRDIAAATCTPVNSPAPAANAAYSSSPPASPTASLSTYKTP
jgi:hypothetical protein